MAGGYPQLFPAVGLLRYSDGMSADDRPGTARRTGGFEATILPHVDSVFRFAMWLIRDRTEAEDIVQETLAQALQSFHRFQPGPTRGLVLTILRTSEQQTPRPSPQARSGGGRRSP